VTTIEATAVVSSVLAGLVGGVFFAFSVFVMRALEQLAPVMGISAMQRINVTVINPLFLGPLLGTAPLLAFSAYLAGAAGQRQTFAWLLAAVLTYTVGSVGVTLALNVPHNNKLADMHPASDAAAAYWPLYVREWLLWNHVRCAAALAASAAATIAISATSASARVAA
jgi:uncharacterized membrane protein